MFKWFSKKETDVKALEKELAALASKVNKHEASLAQLRSSARRLKGATTLYSVVFYAIYLAIWAAFLARNTHDRTRWMYETLPIILGPICIYLVRRAVSAYYDRGISSQENQLEVLKSQQKEKIEEFKTKTDFYTTKSLIDRYSNDESGIAHSPESKGRTATGSSSSEQRSQKDNDVLQARLVQQQQQQQQQQQPIRQSPRLLMQSQMTPQRPPQSLIGTVPTPSSLSGSPQHWSAHDPPKSAEFAPNADAHQVMGERHWYDRMLDIIVGEDEGSEKSRYRLESTIREREEKIMNLELEVMKLRQMVDGDGAAPTASHGPTQNEREQRHGSSLALSARQGTTALKDSGDIKTRPKRRTRGDQNDNQHDDESDDDESSGKL